MIRKSLQIIFFILLVHSASSQDMEQGYTLLENGNYPEAQMFFENILKEFPNNKTARICQARSMGLSNQKLEALENLQLLESEFPQDYEVGLNIAEAYMWNKDFDAALSKYEVLIHKDKNNFVAHLGMANAKAGKNQNTLALQFINKALEIQPGNLAALNSKKYIFIALAYHEAQKRNHKESKRYLDSIELIEANQTNALEIRELLQSQRNLVGNIQYSQSSDNVENLSENISVFQSISLWPKNRLSILASKRTTNNRLRQNEANQSLVELKDKIYFGKETELELGVSAIQNKSIEQNKNNVLASASISSKLNAYHFVSLGYNSNFLNYNSELLNSNLKLDNYRLDYHLFTKANVGFFNSATLSDFSDGNQSQRLFSSLYYQWKQKPIVKIGVNYNYVHFEKSNPELYFSPDKYQATETFVHIESLEGKSKWLYKILIAYGYQQIESNDLQQIFRTECLIGYKISKSFNLNLLYSYTNSAQVNAIGSYEFQNLGLRLDTRF